MPTSSSLLARPTGLAVFVSPLTTLPGFAEPQPATIIVDQATGKVLDVVQGELAQDEGSLKLEQYSSLKVDKFVKVPEGRVLLPGLVE